MKNRPKAPDPLENCPVTRCLNVIGGKWKPVILFCINNGVYRFGAMQRAIPRISKQMLTQQLRELEADGIISRTIFPEVPPRVEYAMTSRGRTILPIVDAMREWGETDQKKKSIDCSSEQGVNR